MPSEGKDSSGHNEDDEALRPYYLASDEEVRGFYQGVFTEKHISNIFG